MQNSSYSIGKNIIAKLALILSFIYGVLYNYQIICKFYGMYLKNETSDELIMVETE
ncbi:hypothetical protein ACT453_04670 [Bacillus sp. D-CC]